MSMSIVFHANCRDFGSTSLKMGYLSCEGVIYLVLVKRLKNISFIYIFIFRLYIIGIINENWSSMWFEVQNWSSI